MGVLRRRQADLYGIGADTLLAILSGDQPRQRDQRRLGGGIAGQGKIALHAQSRGGEDHRAFALLEHHWNAVFTAQHRPA
ncbi:hypothetical protein D9M68_861660 [compost metagenome]